MKELIGIPFLQKFGYGDKFIQIIKVAITKIQSKIKINGLLSDPFTIMRGVGQWFHISLARIKGIEIGDHEIEITNVADYIIIFLRDFTCFNRIQVIWKLYEHPARTLTFKYQALWARAYKYRSDQPGQIEWTQFPTKIIGVNFVNSVPDNSKWDNVSEGTIKKINMWKRVRLSLRGKKIIINQILLSKLCSLVKYILFQNISKRKLNEHTISWERKISMTSQAPRSTGLTWYFRRTHLVTLSKW